MLDRRGDRPDLETALQKPISDLSIAAIAAAQTFMRFKLPFLLTSPVKTLGGDDHRSAPNDHDNNRQRHCLRHARLLRRLPLSRRQAR
jgi:hypothetical protein